ncbi:MAG: YfhO family protein, partial [Chloroflexi bacterium]|nr:YfhO family protein [Chloroflexota bacterium]
MNETTRVRWFLLAILLIALAAAWPELGQAGLLNTRGGGDSPFLLQRLHQLETAVLDGHFPVRWMPDANYGYGYPFYNFYAPLSIYITLIFRLIGFSFVRAIHLSHLLGYLVAGWGTFALARRWFNNGSPSRNWAGLLAAAAYTVAPFHLVNVYVRGDSLAEFWAMAFYPLVILAADGLFSGRRRQIGLFGLAYAALILSHNISALIFSPFLLLYLLLRWRFGEFLPQRAQKVQRNNNLQRSANATPISNHIFGIILALALAAWFFAPALAEQSLAQLDTVTSGYFHFSNHFLGTADHPLTQSTFFVDYGVGDREAFRMGLVQTAVSILGLIGLIWQWWRRKSHAPALFILLTLVVSSFMLTPLSALLWQHLPLLSFTQFPWRFLSVQAFGGALAAGALAMMLPQPKWWALPLIGVLLFSSLARLKPDYLPLTDADVTAVSLARYEWFTGNIGTTISFEYLPPTVQPRPYTSNWLNSGERWQVRPLSGKLLTASLQNQRSTKQQWVVETAVSSTLIFPTMQWPGWAAWVDGEQVAIRPSAGSGLIQLEVPAGRHDIVLRLTRTPVRLVAELVSLTAVLLTIWLLKPNRSWFGKATWLGLATLLLLAFGLRLWPKKILPNDLRTWDFVQMGYLHPDVDGIGYSSGALLRGYTMPQSTIQPGELFQIELQWETPPTEDVTLALFSPAINWATDPNVPLPLPLAQQTLPGNTAVTQFNLHLPKNAPAGLFVPRLTLANGRALTPVGSSRHALFLQPIRIMAHEATQSSTEQLAVQTTDVQQIAPDRLDVRLSWFTAQPLSQNYNIVLRLTDAQGRFLRLLDVQPGYGFLPSSGW